MNVGKVLLLAAYTAAVGAGGYFVGSRYGMDSEYRVQRTGDQAALHVKSTGATYQLTQVGNDTFLGNADYQFKGAKVLTTVDAQNAMKPQIDALEKRIKEIEAKTGTPVQTAAK